MRIRMQISVIGIRICVVIRMVRIMLVMKIRIVMVPIVAVTVAQAAQKIIARCSRRSAVHAALIVCQLAAVLRCKVHAALFIR